MIGNVSDTVSAAFLPRLVCLPHRFAWGFIGGVQDPYDKVVGRPSAQRRHPKDRVSSFCDVPHETSRTMHHLLGGTKRCPWGTKVAGNCVWRWMRALQDCDASIASAETRGAALVEPPPSATWSVQGVGSGDFRVTLRSLPAVTHTFGWFAAGPAESDDAPKCRDC